MAYSDKHKIILQTILHEEHNNVALVINAINAKLQHLNMAIKYINCEIDGKTYWILTNTVQDAIKGLYIGCSKAELDLLRNIYSTIASSSEGYVSSTWCLNLCSSLKVKLSKDNAQLFLNDMVEKKWLSWKVYFFYIILI
ncbi:Non-structural maintenance of chromosomes element 1-like protein [Harpegnathos saltator]|uniref:Non-structural maintenance of chromosomes element 1-like protein n=1 Tax=Harpegnathos saltator TaxID=610380 RepID=E2BN33_HARSA|nr:Non-structural maintenance of chromosomes element 1-like protein [Harpegnathos saltator]